MPHAVGSARRLSVTRTRLPARRHGITMPVHHRNQTFDCTFGMGDDGHVREAFMRSTKEGNDFSALMVDACIAVSMLLQHGERMETLVEAFGENRAEGETIGEPQSALGAIVRAGAEIDRRAQQSSR
jgi:hypothetical protein